MWNAIRAEFIKLTTTRSFYITSLLYFLFGIGLAGMVGFGTRQLAANPEIAEANADVALDAQGLLFAVDVVTVIFMVQAVLMVTSEYSRNQSTSTFTAIPQRWRVVVAKWLLYAVLAAIISLVTVLVALYLGKFIAGDAAASMDIWGDEHVQRALWAKPIAIMLSVTFAMGMAWLLRNTAGTLLVVLVWSFGLESILGVTIPKVGPYISGYGPFNHLAAFQSTMPVNEGPDWGATTSGLYFAAWALAFFVAGAIVMNKRDA
ncbi:ABC-2 family transporter protein [Corynebacterium ciconiae DSM 44920]|uniref:ABC transporter permease subunit n=1 Tax=Corynebacterium ciconiae TaxID=227319 RepID=UPI00037D0956|nr:ABC transporter permease subunit [Corynebacterium ciconiae]WKD61998.1 ABC-2 family transporter protein [Corynebacterium ciconiae DSM 44920]